MVSRLLLQLMQAPIFYLFLGLYTLYGNMQTRVSTCSSFLPLFYTKLQETSLKWNKHWRELKAAIAVSWLTNASIIKCYLNLVHLFLLHRLPRHWCTTNSHPCTSTLTKPTNLSQYFHFTSCQPSITKCSIPFLFGHVRMHIYNHDDLHIYTSNLTQSFLPCEHTNLPFLQPCATIQGLLLK